jgi:hypothetical protein
MPELDEQANVALRHHCKEGDIKWVSLLLWAGADPLKPGSDEPGQELPDSYDGLSALGYAALYEHYEVFGLKPIRTRKMDACRIDYVACLYRGEGTEVLRRLLAGGYQPNDLENGGCSTIGRIIESLSWGTRWRATSDPWQLNLGRPKADYQAARDAIKAIHLLAKYGARWIPKDKAEIASARRSLLQMTADYTLEFVWIMSKYRSCDLAPVKDLLGTPTMKSHVADHRKRLAEFLASWDAQDASAGVYRCPVRCAEVRAEYRIPLISIAVVLDRHTTITP